MDGSGGKERKRDGMFRMLDRLLAFLLVAYLFFIGILPLAGLEPFGVLSGSMTPTVRAGDLVYLKKDDIHPVSTGDVIAFRLSGGNFVLHRVQRKEDGAFVTKGDANETEDFSPVAEDQVYGKMVFVLRKGAVIYDALRSYRTLLYLAGYFLVRGIFRKGQKRKRMYRIG